MSSEKSHGFGDYDKYHDVGLGLRLQHQQNHVYSPSSGEGTRRMTFTANQRQELERQTVIYKYIMASIPVPPELIIPLSKYPSPPLLHHTDQSSNRRAMELRYSGGGGGGGGGGRGVGIGDAEPWRCRRTDGKKWRCSRDVAPNQKYCERHSSKSRPSARSRKPVESSLLVSSASTTATTTTTTTTSNPISLNPFQHHSTPYDFPSSLRYPDWFTKEEATVVTTAQVSYPQQIERFPGENRGHSHSHPLPRPFIDAWSLEDVHKSKCRNTSSSTNTNLPLTLSMSAGFDPENRQTNAKDDDHGIRQQQPLNWMSPWTNMPSGGPLAEALCLGMSGTTNAWGSQSPHGHSSSSTSTTMSSKGSHVSGDIGGQGFHLH